MPHFETWDLDTGDTAEIRGVKGKTVYVENDSGAGAVLYIKNSKKGFAHSGKAWYPLQDGLSICFEVFDEETLFLETDTNDTTIHIIILDSGRVTTG